MTYEIVLALFLIVYSNFIFYKSLRYTTPSVRNIKDYFNFDDKSFLYINFVMVAISFLVILFSAATKVVH